MPAQVASIWAEMLPIALLAILQLGASYVPMDPLYPRECLVFILHDAQVRFVLTQHANPLEIETISGNYFSMLVEPHVSALAAQLQRYLDQY